MTEPTYKEHGLRDEFLQMPALLTEIAYAFITLSRDMGIEPVVTRIREAVPGSSGVHEAGRGIDFRDENGGTALYTPVQVAQITQTLNSNYARTDGKETCIHHSFCGGPYHFHLQQAADMAVYSPQPGEKT